MFILTFFDFQNLKPTSKRFSKLHLNLYQVEANQKLEEATKRTKNNNAHPGSFWCHLKIMLFVLFLLYRTITDYSA